MWKPTFLAVVIVVFGAFLAVVIVALVSLIDSVEDHTEPGGFCELHHIPYAVEVISVHYGLPKGKMIELTESQRKWLDDERAAGWWNFRYSHLAHGAGGCVVRKAKFAKVSYCPVCRKADEEWHAKHGQFPASEKRK
jgi:hypothetical protein